MEGQKIMRGKEYRRANLNYRDTVIARGCAGVVISGATAVFLDPSLKGDEDRKIYIKFKSGAVMGLPHYQVVKFYDNTAIAKNIITKDSSVHAFESRCPECGAYCMAFVGFFNCPIENCTNYVEKGVEKTYGSE